MHLCKFGFKDDYATWTAHGERLVDSHFEGGHDEGFGETNRIDDMLVELGGNHSPPIDEEPTESARAFYRMVASADQSVHENTTHSSLSAVARLLALKSQYNMSIAHFEANLNLIHELLPPGSKLPKDFYQSKKLLEGLGMPYIKIDVCYNNCILYYKDNENKDKCDICDTSRYEEGHNRVPRKVLRYLPITDRLQRLYAHAETAKLMKSHKRSTFGKMVHPCDGEAWQQFDEDFPDFASDCRNVRLAFATDGFTPFSLSAAPYSCWPVFVTPLNFPPSTIMKSEYIFLTLVVPGPEHPGKKLNVLMQPLVDELMRLWEGVKTWDASLKQNFTMRAAYLWSVHDFPAYGNFAGWSTHGKFACPVCLCDSIAFTLRYGHKACWFDCHRRFLPRGHEFRFQANAFCKNTVVLDEAPRHLSGEEIFAQMNTLVGDIRNFGKVHNWTHVSCFWQLPYFHKLLLPHNIDVMHNEKNVAEAIWNTCFDIPDKTKDNAKARQDLAEICNRPALHLKLKENGKWDKPRAPFVIDKNDKPKILKWFQELKLPDGYAANIRKGVNLLQKKIFGLKSHDYHIFMERLLPVAFRGFLPENIWVCLAELSFFYRQLCAKELSKDTICSLEQ
ncbi:uncharacterized protein LOC133917925 [Phragmites australis]|uniref:uncharacterized protein LOC133917925 n=1 Tax=Phragmites australis TaxID=29695 RepID=UPI002D783B27|nr:uncharacterized protein LOC133917925 [Phragmites australis]